MTKTADQLIAEAAECYAAVNNHPDPWGDEAGRINARGVAAQLEAERIEKAAGTIVVLSVQARVGLAVDKLLGLK